MLDGARIGGLEESLPSDDIEAPDNLKSSEPI